MDIILCRSSAVRIGSICLLLALVCLGCNRAEEARRRELAQQNLKQLELAVRNYHTASAAHDAVESDGEADSSDQESEVLLDVEAIVDGGNRFALDLYRQLSSDSGNLFFSPASLSTALAMTSAGAAGKTEVEMAATLHLPARNEDLHAGMKSLQTFWESPDSESGIRLNLANRLWGRASFDFLPAFLDLTRDNYAAELARLDFAESETARQTINSWVEEQTENKIQDLIPPGVLTAETRLVLTNAVYFHGVWSDPFNPDATREDDFHVTAGERIKVPMMQRRDEFRFGAVDDVQILELPYGDGSLSMLVLLPRELDGLSGLEAELNYENLQRWTASMKHENDVKVTLPRFKITSRFQMSETLRAMGMVSAFDPGSADFSAIAGSRDLILSEVIHQAFVDVGEEGTEAAAATGAVISPTSIAPPRREPPVFRADHPFVFVIRDHRNGAILFVGRVTRPSA